MILNDYKCPRHGLFEGSHAICPHMGCDSAGVSKQFIKAPGTKSDYTKNFDAGMRRNAEVYRQSDFKTARAGESAKANNRANELRWGNEANTLLGGNPIQMSGLAREQGKASLGMVSGHQPLPGERIMGNKAHEDAARAQLIREAQSK